MGDNRKLAGNETEASEKKAPEVDPVTKMRDEARREQNAKEFYERVWMQQHGKPAYFHRVGQSGVEHRVFTDSSTSQTTLSSDGELTYKRLQSGTYELRPGSGTQMIWNYNEKDGSCSASIIYDGQSDANLVKAYSECIETLKLHGVTRVKHDFDKVENVTLETINHVMKLCEKHNVEYVPGDKVLAYMNTNILVNNKDREKFEESVARIRANYILHKSVDDAGNKKSLEALGENLKKGEKSNIPVKTEKEIEEKVVDPVKEAKIAEKKQELYTKVLGEGDKEKKGKEAVDAIQTKAKELETLFKTAQAYVKEVEENQAAVNGLTKNPNQHEVVVDLPRTTLETTKHAYYKVLDAMALFKTDKAGTYYAKNNNENKLDTPEKVLSRLLANYTATKGIKQDGLKLAVEQLSDIAPAMEALSEKLKTIELGDSATKEEKKAFADQKKEVETIFKDVKEALPKEQEAAKKVQEEEKTLEEKINNARSPAPNPGSNPSP